MTTTDFQSFWRLTNKNKQLSEFGCHFGHYKSTSHDRYITALHCAKLTLAVTTGIPLARWGQGLTILLEKVFGNIYINKMRATCLLKADYNWLNKYMFKKRMMDKAFSEGIVPAEQFAKWGLQASHGVLALGLFCDIACALHRTSAIESVDLANCYNAVAHHIANVALQSFKVRKVMVVMMLYVVETMQWFLKTAFGQSETLFGGTRWDPSMGLGQRNDTAPPGFLAVRTLMLKSREGLRQVGIFNYDTPYTMIWYKFLW